ncbi:MAG: hypothetical protein PF569_06375 [Candidatus Woesearchaeota archaeon]|jgi:hypothetical protein|nr:hypothetical protein [Candidatus Woesearchaeota archaeon]
MGKHISLSNKFMGGAIIIALIIQNISFLSSFRTIATLIYLIVAIYLLFIA